MFRKRWLLFLTIFLFLYRVSSAYAVYEFTFCDLRFRNKLTTENLDAIIDEYELFDGWYWTTEADIPQDFHGHPECPGWTSTAQDLKVKAIKKGWYGCRWPIDHVRKTAPEKGGYAECFAFAQFIGYLLSGEINPQHNWEFYYSVEAAGGLRVGDILRAEYKINKKEYHHSAVVYAVEGDDVRFLQVSGASCNKISVGAGFTDGHYINETSIEKLSAIRGVKVSRYFPDRNCD